MEDIPVTYTIIRDKKWIFMGANYTVQCAYCIYVQVTSLVRDDTGLLTAIRLVGEHHTLDCPQAGDSKSRDSKASE